MSNDLLKIPLLPGMVASTFESEVADHLSEEREWDRAGQGTYGEQLWRGDRIEQSAMAHMYKNVIMKPSPLYTDLKKSITKKILLSKPCGKHCDRANSRLKSSSYS